MKYALIALLVALYSVGHASGKAHHSLRDLDDDEESARSSRSARIDRCMGRLASCQVIMEKYQSFHRWNAISVFPDSLNKYLYGPYWDNMSSFADFIKAGSKQVCSDMLSATQCLQESIDVPDCDILIDVERDILIRIIAYFQRFCFDKFIELERNWLCLVNVTENEDLNQCWVLHRNLYYETCNPGPLADCVADWYKANSACEEEGLELILDMYIRYKDIKPNCKSQEPESQEMDAVFEDKYGIKTWYQ